MTTSNAELYLGDLNAASKLIPSTVPYIMMNLFKFKPVAQYAADYTGPKLESMTGREIYNEYKTKFGARAKELGVDVSLIFIGQAHTQIVAGLHEGENWDLVLLAKFPNWEGFKKVLEDEVYVSEIQPLRVAALQDLRSFAVTEGEGV